MIPHVESLAAQARALCSRCFLQACCIAVPLAGMGACAPYPDHYYGYDGRWRQQSYQHPGPPAQWGDYRDHDGSGHQHRSHYGWRPNQYQQPASYQ